MDLSKWIGRYAAITRLNDERTYSARIEAWDHEKERVLLGPKPVYIPLSEIVKIMPAEPGPFRRGTAAGLAARPHSVGYIMKENVQFDNAIQFRSPVMIWKGDRIVHYRTLISAHDEKEVTLRSGEKLSKLEHRFIVRVIRGN
ncbi:hypothetical protein AWM70_10945 [Paenibacillus yonginensis]|uniref:Uncharacterized protein n=1 Tax=Paenibacillus yonginensis TaxID=1462996 RepID=A0A1B1N0W8_9BACL|nr:hypothetical protein [Paenibacillus yonginensis]ANS75056.1 hypothetical protein AWM70_10945 [Paenibacillus yonginensis]